MLHFVYCLSLGHLTMLKKLTYESNSKNKKAAWNLSCLSLNALPFKTLIKKDFWCKKGWQILHKMEAKEWYSSWCESSREWYTPKSICTKQNDSIARNVLFNINIIYSWLSLSFVTQHTAHEVCCKVWLLNAYINYVLMHKQDLNYIWQPQDKITAVIKP